MGSALCCDNADTTWSAQQQHRSSNRNSSANNSIRSQDESNNLVIDDWLAGESNNYNSNNNANKNREQSSVGAVAYAQQQDGRETPMNHDANINDNAVDHQHQRTMSAGKSSSSNSDLGGSAERGGKGRSSNRRVSSNNGSNSNNRSAVAAALGSSPMSDRLRGSVSRENSGNTPPGHLSNNSLGGRHQVKSSVPSGSVGDSNVRTTVSVGVQANDATNSSSSHSRAPVMLLADMLHGNTVHVANDSASNSRNSTNTGSSSNNCPRSDSNNGRSPLLPDGQQHAASSSNNANNISMMQHLLPPPQARLIVPSIPLEKICRRLRSAQQQFVASNGHQFSAALPGASASGVSFIGGSSMFDEAVVADNHLPHSVPTSPVAPSTQNRQQQRQQRHHCSNNSNNSDNPSLDDDDDENWILQELDRLQAAVNAINNANVKALPTIHATAATSNNSGGGQNPDYKGDEECLSESVLNHNDDGTREASVPLHSRLITVPVWMLSASMAALVLSSSGGAPLPSPMKFAAGATRSSVSPAPPPPPHVCVNDANACEVSVSFSF